MYQDDEYRDVIVNKVNLKDLIETLIEIHETGTNYIDLVISPGKIKDNIRIVIKDGYSKLLPKPLRKLNDEDVNMLMNL